MRWIRRNKASLKKHFNSLNCERLQEHFTVEPADEKLLSDSRGQIWRVR